jgi:hypothetical protein
MGESMSDGKPIYLRMSATNEKETDALTADGEVLYSGNRPIDATLDLLRQQGLSPSMHINFIWQGRDTIAVTKRLGSSNHG